ncbi:hypothetical protein NHX12_015541 [Muraenolepis orangiensis]|uniref:NACHT domain-containing protein n=1 Tax=Muraenolepis orangiensis TaxID=630683 RepID=A0A9Q0D8B4_9TELE|nr:hypothetical protein NHX12_015541 [Muraenolepis orangiensis]
MTTGVAGIGKTVLTNKFTLDWAEGKANHDIHLTLPFTFRELNLLKEKEFSLVELLHHFFIQTKGICRYDLFQVVFILDGLDECRLPLNFQKNPIWTDVTKSTSVDVLLTNLIRGDLLPSARIWITTRPAAANQIPAECVGMVTEVRGFTDPQKEEYFWKRFGEVTLASTIISHIKTSRSLHIMERGGVGGREKWAGEGGRRIEGEKWGEKRRRERGGKGERGRGGRKRWGGRRRRERCGGEEDRGGEEEGGEEGEVVREGERKRREREVGREKEEGERWGGRKRGRGGRERDLFTRMVKLAIMTPSPVSGPICDGLVQTSCSEF